MGLEINCSNGSNIRVGIDIGTSKVVCLIAEYVDHELRVIVGSQTSQGLKNGVIGDIESTVSWSTLLDAELMSSKQVTSFCR